MADGRAERGTKLGYPALRLNGIENSSIMKALG
jgi:hypothetical protein